MVWILAVPKFSWTNFSHDWMVVSYFRSWLYLCDRDRMSIRDWLVPDDSHSCCALCGGGYSSYYWRARGARRRASLGWCMMTSWVWWCHRDAWCHRDFEFQIPNSHGGWWCHHEIFQTCITIPNMHLASLRILTQCFREWSLSRRIRVQSLFPSTSGCKRSPKNAP